MKESHTLASDPKPDLEMTTRASDVRPAPGWILTVLGIAAALAFLAIEITGHGFHDLRLYDPQYLHRLPRGETLFYIRYLALILPAAVLAALGIAFLVGRRPFDSALDRLAAIPERAFRVGVAVIGAALVLAVAFLVLRNQPVTDDENVYLFQADILKHGKLYEESQPLQEFFDNVSIVNTNEKWYGKYPPGHPLALLPGVAIGFPRAVPAILAALNLLLFYALARRFFSLRAARAAIVLLLASPFFLFTGATLLAETTCLAALLLFGLGAINAYRSGSANWAIAAGAGAGFALLTRPYTALLVGAPIAASWLVAAARRKSSLKPWVIAAGTTLLFGLAFLGYNLALSGNPFTTGYDAVSGEGARVLGFGPGGHYFHTPTKGLLNVALTFVRLNFWSWGWPLGWLFVAAALIWNRERKLLPLWAVLAATAVGTVFYFSIGVSDTGPVKFYEILPALTLLTVAGLQSVDDRIARPRRPGFAALAPALVVVMTALGWLIFARVQITDLRRVTADIARPYRMVADLEDPRVLIFSGEIQHPPYHSWVRSTPDNLPDPAKRAIYVRDRGRENRNLMARMPERIPYLLAPAKGTGYSLTRLSGDEATKRYAEDKVKEGILFLRQKKMREALQSFLSATQTDPGYAKGYLLMGWAFEQMARPEAAEPAYRKALELEPGVADHYFFLGRFLARQKKFDEAIRMLLQAQLMDPGSKEIETALNQAKSHIPPP